MSKIFLVPFGDPVRQTFAAFPEDAPEALKGTTTITVEAKEWFDREELKDELKRAAQAAGYKYPEIWTYNQVGNLARLVVANLRKDYPESVEYVQKMFGLEVDVNRGDDHLTAAMSTNIRRHYAASLFLSHHRKEYFLAEIQRHAYEKGFGFLNTDQDLIDLVARLQYKSVESDEDNRIDFRVIQALYLGQDIPVIESHLDSVRRSMEFDKLAPIYKSVSGDALMSLKWANGGSEGTGVDLDFDPDRFYFFGLKREDGRRIQVGWKASYQFIDHQGWLVIPDYFWDDLVNKGKLVEVKR